nr:response regulator transcription factor [Pseudonocardia spinosispora]
MPHILVIEDDPELRRRVLRFLTDADFATSSASSGMDGLKAAVETRPDLVVLDLGLPDVTGREVLRMIRAISHVPIIVATGADDEGSVISLLDAGADDYLVKPYGSGQLVARINAVLRRGHEISRQASEPKIVIDRLELDFSRRTAQLDGKVLTLTPKEFELLYYLARRVGEVVTKRQLLTEVWRLPYSHADKTVDVHISWLRRKLGESAQTPRYLHTIRGIGLRLVDPGA